MIKLDTVAVLTLFLGMAACSTAEPQYQVEEREPSETRSPDDGQIVRSIRVQGSVSQKDFSRYLKNTRVGQPLSSTGMAEDIRSLWSDHRIVVVAVSKEPAPGGGVHVNFDVEDGKAAQDSMSPEAAVLIEKKIELAREAVAMAEVILERARTLVESGQSSAAELHRHERDLRLARLQLLERRQEPGRDVVKILREKIVIAEEFVVFEKSVRDLARLLLEQGRGSALELSESEKRMLEARLRVLDYQHELQTTLDAKGN